MAVTDKDIEQPIRALDVFFLHFMRRIASKDGTNVRRRQRNIEKHRVVPKRGTLDSIRSFQGDFRQPAAWRGHMLSEQHSHDNPYIHPS